MQDPGRLHLVHTGRLENQRLGTASRAKQTTDLTLVLGIDIVGFGDGWSVSE